jgi:hypothetical protein
MQPVGRHHEARPYFRFLGRTTDPNTDDAAALQQRSTHPAAFLYTDTTAAGMIEQYLIERWAWDTKTRSSNGVAVCRIRHEE